MFGTYKEEDVTILLKDITGLVEPQSTEEREQLIQNGKHYCEMLPIEYKPSEKYMNVFNKTLKLFGKTTAIATGVLAQKIFKEKGPNVVLVSLARAGTPIGILLKHYIQKKYGVNVPHYTISIIRGKGIDKNAMNYILERHSPESIQFVDGWTGKGAIKHQLEEAMKDYPNVDTGLAVLSDPAKKASLCGNSEDFLIPSSLLNSTVSGLLSRTFLRDDIISPNDFHGALFYKDLIDEDLTYHFINTIESHFNFDDVNTTNDKPSITAEQEVKNIAKKFDITDINLVKPSIGEATRVLLRRVPEVILVHCKADFKNLEHIYALAAEKNVPVVEYPLKNYKVCGIIKQMGDV